MPEYNIKVEFEKKTFSFSCQDDQDIISAASINGIDLPKSCCSGVCTSCAARILEGFVEQEDAMGLNDDLREKGFALLCVAYPCLLYTSPSPRDISGSRMPSSA